MKTVDLILCCTYVIGFGILFMDIVIWRSI